MSSTIPEPTPAADDHQSGTLVTRILSIIGRILVGGGILLLLFTAFELWGTGFLETHSQAVLRSQIEGQLPDKGNIPAALKTNASNYPPQTAPTTAPPPDGQPIGTIIMPKIGVNQVILEGTQTQDLRQGPGHYPGTALPGQAGNASIAGHRTTYAKPFYNLNEMAPGDLVFTVTPQGAFAYKVVSVESISPSDASVLQPTPTPTLTLTTCNPRYSASQRLVVHADLVASILAGAKAPPTNTKPNTNSKNSDSLAGAATGFDWLLALLWGILLLAVGFGTWLLAKRTKHRILVSSGGGIVFLIVLFLFFVAVSPLVPGTF